MPGKSGIVYDSAGGRFLEVELDEAGNVTGEGRPLDLRTEAGPAIVASYFNGGLFKDGRRVSPDQFAEILAALGSMIRNSLDSPTDQQLGAALRAAYTDDPRIVGFVYAKDSQFAWQVWPAEVIGRSLDEVEFIDDADAAPPTVKSSIVPKEGAGATEDVQGVGPVSKNQGNGGGAATRSDGKSGGGVDGKPSVDSNGDGSSSETGNKTGGDPVLLASGAFFHQVTDLMVPGRGLHFAFTRTYIHQMAYKGPLGYSWDHNYNLWLRERQEMRPDGSLCNVVYRSTGQLRQDPYVQIIDAVAGDLPPLDDFRDAVFEGPPGFFDRLEKSGGRYVLESPRGVRIEYGESLFAERIVDPNGNTLTLTYDGELLAEIIDPVGKHFTLRYDELHRISVLRDEIGRREIRFSYSSNGDLEEVDLLLGELIIGTDYRYTGADRPAELQHNLTEVIGPTGESVLRVDYGEDWNAWNYNRVVRQRAEDGELAYEYAIATESDVDPAFDPDNIPATVTRVHYQNGNAIEHWFNRQGNVVRRSEQILSQSGAIETLVGRYRYNRDGSVIEQIRPDGLRLEWRYQREFHAALNGGDTSAASPVERMAFGNLRQTIVHPRPGLGETRRIVCDLVYTRDNRLAGHRGPYYADAELHELPGQKVAELAFDYDIRGNLTVTRHGEVTAFDGARGAVAAISNRYDIHGQLVETSNGLTAVRFVYFEDRLRSGLVKEAVEDPEGAALRTAYEVDALGRATRTTGPWGATVDTEWTLFDAPRRIFGPEVAPGSRPVTRFRYDKQRKPVRIEEQLLQSDGEPHPEIAHVISMKYDRYSRRIELRHGSEGAAAERVVKTSYLPIGLPERTIDPRGTVTKTEYDPRLFVRAVTTAAGAVEAATTRWYYGRAGEVLRIEDPMGNSTRYDYDAFGRTRRIHAPDQTTYEMEHDAVGHVTRVRLFGKHPETGVAQRWSESEFRYDELGRLIERLDHVFTPGDPAPASIARTRFVFDPFGRLIRTIDAAGAVTTREYDALNRLTRWLDAEGGETCVSYDDGAHTVTTVLTDVGVDERGAAMSQCTRTVVAFDPRGLPVSTTDGSGVSTLYAYDSRGLCTATILPDGTVHNTEYDVFGQPVRISSPLEGHQAQVEYEYDAGGNLTRFVNPLGGEIRQAFDALNRLVSSERDDGTRTSVEYDRLGQITRYVDENGLVLSRSYGADGRLRSEEVDPSGFVPVPVLPDYRPEPLGRREYSYTPLGDLARISDPTGAVIYRTDSLGRVVEEHSEGRSVKFVRDALGRVVSFTYPRGRKLRFDLSPMGKLAGIRQLSLGEDYPGNSGLPAERDLAVIQHVGSRPSSIRFGESHRAVPHYDPMLRLVGMDWRQAGGDALLAAERVLYGKRGEVRVQQVDDRTRAFDYDALLRLVASRDVSGLALASTADLAPARDVVELANSPRRPAVDARIAAVLSAMADRPTARRTTYALDDSGNRLGTTESASAGPVEHTDYLVTHHDQYRMIGGRPQVYDRAGNLLSDGLNRYVYDLGNRLTAIETPAGEIRLSRDPAGRINRLSRENVSREIVYAGLRVIECSTDGAIEWQLVPLLRPNQFAHLAAGGKEFAPIFDTMDTVLGWVEAGGAVAGRSSYDPFGKVLSRTGEWPAPLGYGGFLEDGVSQISHLAARGYDPRQGRFLQRDPLGFVDGLNRYTFARNAPVTMTDHFGFKAAEIDYGIAGLGLGSMFLSTAALATMFYVFRLAATINPQGRAAMIMGTLLSYVIGKALSDTFIKNVGDAEKSGGSVSGAAVLSVADAVLPIRAGYEAFTGKAFYPQDAEHPFLDTRDRSLAVGATAGGATLAGLGAALWLSGRLGRASAVSDHSAPPPDPPAGSSGGSAGAVVSVSDQGDLAATLVAIGRAQESGRNPTLGNFAYGVASGAETLVLTLHGLLARNARGSKRGAMGVALSDFLAGKLGLGRPSGAQLPIPGGAAGVAMMSPELLAMYTVHYLKFRGSMIHLDACGTGYYSSFLDQSFVEAYAQVLAQHLKHPVTVEGPRGLLYADPLAGISWVQPNAQTPRLPADQAMNTVTAK